MKDLEHQYAIAILDTVRESSTSLTSEEIYNKIRDKVPPCPSLYFESILGGLFKQNYYELDPAGENVGIAIFRVRKPSTGNLVLTDKRVDRYYLQATTPYNANQTTFSRN